MPLPMAEYVTRPEHEEAMRRLDAADVRLEEALHSLRRELEDKISSAVKDLRADLRDDIASVKNDLSDELVAINDRLSWQNKVWLVPLISTIMLGILYAFFTYVLHVTPSIG